MHLFNFFFIPHTFLIIQYLHSRPCFHYFKYTTQVTHLYFIKCRKSRRLQGTRHTWPLDGASGARMASQKLLTSRRMLLSRSSDEHRTYNNTFHLMFITGLLKIKIKCFHKPMVYILRIMNIELTQVSTILKLSIYPHQLNIPFLTFYHLLY